jgi:hypothetical protein
VLVLLLHLLQLLLVVVLLLHLLQLLLLIKPISFSGLVNLIFYLRFHIA